MPLNDLQSAPWGRIRLSDDQLTQLGVIDDAVGTASRWLAHGRSPG